MVSTSIGELPSPSHRTLRANPSQICDHLSGLKGGRKKPADPVFMRLIGSAIETAIKRCHLEHTAVAADMGFADHTALSKWIAGTETPNFAKLWSIVDLRCELVIALAESCGSGLLVEDFVVISRTLDLGRSA